MFVLLGFSIVGLAIIILKAYHFYKLDISRTSLFSSLTDCLSCEKYKDAVNLLEAAKNPGAEVACTALNCCLSNKLSEKNIRAEVRRVGNKKVRELESWLNGLSVIGHLTPLVGLLGTVIGMISAFIAFEAGAGSPDPSILAGGIWEALLTTAFGLAIAIPCLAAYYFLIGQVDKAGADMKDAVTQILIHFNHNNNRNAGRKEPVMKIIDQEHYGI
ncbi:UNVERIFIED_CONTAM: hypothetical protein GTU68_064474 [Idotea baltica]|nr:hypothetical protein [Idotea baltica]